MYRSETSWLESQDLSVFSRPVTNRGPIASHSMPTRRPVPTRRSLLVLWYHILQIILIRTLDRYYIGICVISWNRLGCLSWRADSEIHIRPWFCLVLASTLDSQCQPAAVTDSPVACQRRQGGCFKRQKIASALVSPTCQLAVLLDWTANRTNSALVIAWQYQDSLAPALHKVIHLQASSAPSK